MLMRNLFLFPVFLSCFLAAPAWASPIDDATTLYEEAQAALKKMNGVAADPKAYAEVVRKLEKAQSLLEEAEKTDAAGVARMEQSVSSALFWARKFTNVYVMNELDKSKGAKLPEPKAPPPKTAEKAPEANAAEAEFKKAEEYEKAHQGNDYAIALRWFQYSDQFSGTELSLRANARACDAQARYRAAEGAKLAATQTLSEDAKLITAGNEFFAQKDFEVALVKFEQAKKIANTVAVEQRIGQAWLQAGYKIRDEYAAQYLPLMNRFNDARRRNDRNAMAGLVNEERALDPLASKALKDYDNAQLAFQHGLDLAKGKNLICEAHIGIIHFARGASGSKTSARTVLSAVLNKYVPGNDEERTVFEFARSLLGKLR